MRLAVGDATAGNLGKALGDSMTSKPPGQPVEYQAYEVKGAHNSVIIKVGE